MNPMLPLEFGDHAAPVGPGPQDGAHPPRNDEEGTLLRRCRPFLKWAGGKRQLLPALLAQVDRLGPFGAYHEPFLGGGALFFELWNQGRIRDGVTLSDINGHLVEVYQAIATDVHEVIRHLRNHQDLHCREHYYATRDSMPETPPERAARFLYLNRTCFNGLYRENRSGRFNVPMGRYRNPTICDEPALHAAAWALARALLKTAPFEEVLEVAQAGDLVYFDPPYVPLSRTSSFTSYAASGFAAKDQERLAEVFRLLASRGVHAMLSNSKTDQVLELYSGFRIRTVSAARAVNSRPDRRGPVEEVLVTSF